MNIRFPHGMIERMGERSRKPGTLPRYGRGKDGSPKDVQTLSIAAEQDRRSRPRQDDAPLRGRLLDMDA